MKTGNFVPETMLKATDSDPRLQPFCWDFGGKTVEFQWILQWVADSVTIRLKLK